MALGDILGGGIGTLVDSVDEGLRKIGLLGPGIGMRTPQTFPTQQQSPTLGPGVGAQPQPAQPLNANPAVAGAPSPENDRAAKIASGQIAAPDPNAYVAGEPSRGRKIGAVLGGIGEGILSGGSIPKGIAMADYIRNGPQRNLDKQFARDTAEYGLQAKQGQAQEAAQNTALGQEKTKAETQRDLGEAAHQQAEADALRNPTPKVGLTGDEQTFASMQGKINPATGKLYTDLEITGAIAQAKQDVKPNKALTLEEQYDEAIKSGNTTRSNQLLTEMRSVSGAKKEPKDMTAHNDARSDKSYQFNSTQLETLRKPIEQRVEKIGIAIDNLQQRTPQGDALAAPEILTAMVGGQGSGLRMNEAEISRIIGGATKWTQLKTQLNKWSLDPQHVTFTDDQRNQMMAILKAGRDKASKKQAAIEEAEQGLVDHDDPQDHRKIVNDARKKLDSIDGGQGQAATGGESKDEFGQFGGVAHGPQ